MNGQLTAVLMARTLCSHSKDSIKFCKHSGPENIIFILNWINIAVSSDPALSNKISVLVLTKIHLAVFTTFM